MRSRCTNGLGRMQRLRSAGDRTVKTTVADSDARVGYRISVCSSGAASICQRASTKGIGHTIHSRVPHRGPASGAAQLPVSSKLIGPSARDWEFV